MAAVEIIQYKWEGSWGPFKIKVECGECNITHGIIEDVLEKEFQGEDISFKTLPWLDNWYKVILKGGWHAPIVVVNGKVIEQGKVIDRGQLAHAIRKELSNLYQVSGNVIFTKPGCTYCREAKELLQKNNIVFEERDIIADSRAAHELFTTTKKFFPKNKPVTVPQIWLSGKYIGGTTELKKHLS